MPETLGRAAVPADLQRLGLTTAEAERRRQNGTANQAPRRTSRSYAGIIRANVFTRFNAIVSSLMVVVLTVGEPIDALFGFVMIFNSLIGIVQELRAKRTLDALQVLVTPAIGVLRNGVRTNLAPDDIVLDDVLLLEPGDQIPVDAEVVFSEGLEVDESALTGESEPLPKKLNDEVMSGSFVVAGSSAARVMRIGEDCWINSMTAEAKDFAISVSELRTGIDRILQVISWLIPVLGALLLWSQLRSAATVADGLVWAISGMVALVPQGLVLLVSMAMAVAVIRLGRNDVLVQELPAVEILARADILCVDKTGTLTTGDLAIDRTELFGISSAELSTALSALFRLEAARSATIEAIRPILVAGPTGWHARHAVPFSSVRKWSGADFGKQGTWIFGAPEILLESVSPDRRTPARVRVDELTAMARRVLLLAYSDDGLQGERLPAALTPVAIIALKEEVRPDAAETMRYFQEQNVQIRVISGDNPRTVSAVAGELGIAGAASYVDMRTVDSLESIAEDVSVFGRVLPDQKRDLVKLLQERGHTVAMTGDGVNDIPSLKAADIGIAMNTATAATKSIAQLVLLDGRFERLPGVVAEGRRIIANMERVSSLFITKTVYATILALSVGIAVIPFPFLPRHLSLVSELTIGIPALILSFRPNDQPCEAGYLRRVLEFSVPAGMVAALGTLTAYWASRSSLGGSDLPQARTAATITLALTGLWILYRLARPIHRHEALLIGALLGAFVLTLIPSPVSRFYALSLPPTRTTVVMLAVLGATIAVLQYLLARRERWISHRPRPREGHLNHPRTVRSPRSDQSTAPDQTTGSPPTR